MKKRLFIVIAALLGLSLGKANAQNLPQTREAAELLQKGNLALAQEKIDQAVLSEESGFAYSWFIHAYTYKELYKANPKDSLEYTTRKKAIDSWRDMKRAKEKAEQLPYRRSGQEPKEPTLPAPPHKDIEKQRRIGRGDDEGSVVAN